MPAQLYPGANLAATSGSTPAADSEEPSPPTVRVRGRNFMALVIAPEPPLPNWFAALDAQMRRSEGFFGDRPVVVDLSAVLESLGREGVPTVLDGIEARGLRVIGAEGVVSGVLAGTRWSRLPTKLQGRDVAQAPRADAPTAAAAVAVPSLLIDRPVRSGQSIVFGDGDITVVGSVASGAELIAGGSIHVYGALRGRALAGLKSGVGARIFCRRLEAEMVGVDQLYRTAEHWGPQLHGRAVQVLCANGALQFSPLD
jgi:septum site-determining protein MinC